MIINRSDFSRKTGLGYNITRTLFDRFSIKLVMNFSRYPEYDVTYYDLQNIKEFLSNRKDKKHTDYSKVIKKIDELCEEM